MARKKRGAWSNRQQQFIQTDAPEPFNPYLEEHRAGRFTNNPTVQPHEEADVAEDRKTCALMGLGERETELVVKSRLMQRRHAEHFRAVEHARIVEHVQSQPAAAVDAPKAQALCVYQQSESAQTTANARMIDTLSKTPESKEWSAQQFADHLGLSKGTVGGTPAWKSLMAARAGEKADRIARGKPV